MTVNEMGSPHFPRKGGSGSGTTRVFSVEVRLDYIEPKQYGTFIADREWRTLPVGIASIGVPNKTWSRSTEVHGFLSWEAANALRWWAHAEMGLCLQSRIVEHSIQESYQVTTLGYHDVIGGGGNRDGDRRAHGPTSAASTEPVALNRPSHD